MSGPLRRMYDAAFPPASPPAWEAVAGYLGGDTPHVWTAAEWAAQPARYRLPIWTRSNPTGANQGILDAIAALLAAAQIGMPRGGTIGLDYETAVNATYLNAFDQRIKESGRLTLLYGSQSTVLQNPKPSAGYWIGNWNTPTQPYLDPRSAATQYAPSMPGQPWDSSLVSDTLILWDTRPPAPPPSPSLQEDQMLLVSIVNPPAPLPGPGIFLLSPAGYRHVATTDDLTAFRSLNTPEISISYAQHLALLGADD